MESSAGTIAPALRRGALALFAAVLGALALAGCGANGTSRNAGAYEKTNYLTDEAANQRAVNVSTANEQAWAKEGVKITAVGPDIPRNRGFVNFSTADVPATARSTLLQTYGPDTTIGPPLLIAGS